MNFELVESATKTGNNTKNATMENSSNEMRGEANQVKRLCDVVSVIFGFLIAFLISCLLLSISLFLTGKDKKEIIEEIRKNNASLEAIRKTLTDENIEGTVANKLNKLDSIEKTLKRIEEKL